jgi:hypothetical protein
MDVDPFMRRIRHRGAEPVIVGLGRVIERHRDMDIAHSERGHRRGLVGQGLFMAVQAKIDDAGDAQSRIAASPAASAARMW